MTVSQQSQHIIVASHQRSGTHLTIDTILNNLVAFREAADPGPITIDRLSSHQAKTWPTLAEVKARARSSRMVFKTHTHGNVADFFLGSPELEEFIRDLFDRSKVIYVHRDGRDVLVSLYYYMKRNPQVEGKSFQEFIRMENDIDRETCRESLDRPSYWAFHVDSWLGRSNVLPVSFERLLLDTDAVLREISDFAGEPLVSRPRSVRRGGSAPGLVLDKLSRRWPFSLFARKRHTSVSFRRGQIGDWTEHFSEADSAFFEERAGLVNRARAGNACGFAAGYQTESASTVGIGRDRPS